MEGLFGGSKIKSALTFFCVVLGLLLSASRACADQIQVTYSFGGTFIVVGSNNPWGGTDPYHLTFQGQLSFLLPTTGDLFPTDPLHSKWLTSGTASVTANGTTVEYAGPATIGVNASFIPPMAGGYSNAWISLPGLYLDLSCGPGPVFPGYQNDSVDNLLNLCGYTDVFTQTCYNENDMIRLVGVTTVPDGGSTLALLSGFLVCLHLFRRRFVK